MVEPLGVKGTKPQLPLQASSKMSTIVPISAR
jgi:hypothetical protein